MGTDFAHLMPAGLSGEGGSVAVRRSEEDHWVEILRGLHLDPDARDRWAWLAAGFLLATASRRIRNAAALALADMGAQDASGSIVAVLRRPDIAKESGTLLYALTELGSLLPLNVLIGLIESGSYEARSIALTFLEENRIEECSLAEVEKALVRLRRIAGDRGDPESAEAAALALEYLGGGRLAAQLQGGKRRT